MALTNKTLILTRPSSDEVMLVVAIVLDPETLDIEQLLSALVPEMARGGVPGGLLLVGDSTLVIRLQDEQVMVDELDTTRLLALADIDEDWDQERIVEMMQRWIEGMRDGWRDRLDGQLRALLVPNVVAGLGGDVEVGDGIWGSRAHRLADPA